MPGEVYGDPSPIEISVSAQTLQFNWGFSCPKPVYYDPGGSEKKISASDFHFGFFTIEIIEEQLIIIQLSEDQLFFL